MSRPQWRVLSFISTPAGLMEIGTCEKGTSHTPSLYLGGMVDPSECPAAHPSSSSESTDAATRFCDKARKGYQVVDSTSPPSRLAAATVKSSWTGLGDQRTDGSEIQHACKVNKSDGRRPPSHWRKTCKPQRHRMCSVGRVHAPDLP